MSMLAQDNFIRADNANLGTDWDENTGAPGTGGFDILTNTAVPANLANDSSESNNTVTWPNDQYSQVVRTTTEIRSLSAGSGPMCREASRTIETHYRLIVSLSGYSLDRLNASVATLLSNGASPTFAGGDTARLEVRTNGANCDWIVKKNGTQFASGTDTTPIASGRAGIVYSSTTTTLALAAISSWEGGDFVDCETFLLMAQTLL